MHGTPTNGVICSGDGMVKTKYLDNDSCCSAVEPVLWSPGLNGHLCIMARLTRYPYKCMHCGLHYKRSPV